MPILRKRPKRTVRCSYCHHLGHNKSTCPQYAARIEELRAEYGDDHYAVVSYDYKKNKRKASAKSRKCSYCAESGHNRKTCAALKSHMFQVKVKNIEYRKEIFKAMVTHGIFTGAIVESDSNTRPKQGETGFASNRYRLPMVITRVNWGNINIWESEFRYYSSEMGARSPFRAKPINNLAIPWDYEMGFPLDYDLLWNKMPIDMFEQYTTCSENKNSWKFRNKNSYFCTVVSPVCAEKPPIGWLTCDDTESEKTLKEFFKKRASNQRSWCSYTKGLSGDQHTMKLRKEMAEDDNV